jgi:Spy/CpxP family protein refolding chaperone
MNTTPKGKALFYMAAIFAIGLLAGGVAGGLTGYRFGTQRLLRPPAAEQMAASVKQRLQQELRLTAEQEKQIAPMVDDFVVEMNAVHSNTVERAVTVIRSMHQRVAEVLTPEQRNSLQRMQQEREAEFRRVAHPPER